VAAKHLSKRNALGWAVVCLVLALASCQPRSPQRPPLVIGHQDTPEQRLLAELTALLLEEKGFSVVLQGDFEGPTLRKALLAGTVDIAWDYTGTVWQEYLGHDVPIVAGEELYLRLREEDYPAGITWLPPAPCQQRTGIVVRMEFAQSKGLETLDDLATYARSKDASVILCTTERLASFAGGLRGFAAVYGWDPSPGRVHIAAEEEIAPALEKGTCQAALVPDAYSLADGRKMLALEDNRAFFHASNLAVAVRTNRLIAYPSLERPLSDLSRALTQEAVSWMRSEMARGAKPRTIARRFLREAGLVGRPKVSPTPTPTRTP